MHNTIFLITKDIHIAQKINSYLKEFNTRPYLFESIQSAFGLLYDTKPSLLLIDVSLGLSKEKEKDITQHPLYVKNELSIGLIVDTLTPHNEHYLQEFLRQMVPEGIIFLREKEKEHEMEKLYLKQLLSRVNKLHMLENQLGSLQRTWDQQKNELERTAIAYQNDREKNHLLMRWMHKVETLRYDDFKEDFLTQLGHFFNYWESFVEKFTFYVLSRNLDQLESPLLDFSRYVEMNSSYCSEKMLMGIDFAQRNLAYESAMDLLGPSTLMLGLKKKNFKSDVLIFIQPVNYAKELLKSINWGFLEEILNQFWNRYYVENSFSLSQHYTIVEIWEVIGSILQQEYLLEENKKEAFFLIHLHPFKKLLFSNSVVNVQWKAFIDHFCQEISKGFLELKYLCFLEMDYILFCVDREKCQVLYGEFFFKDILFNVSALIKRFSFLKYFDLRPATSFVIEQLEVMLPKIQYLDLIHKELKDILLKNKAHQQGKGDVTYGKTQRAIPSIRPVAYSQNQ